MAISWVVVLAPIQRFSIDAVSRFSFLSDEVSLTAVSQDSLAAIGDESESTGKTGGADSANEGSNGGERELHIEQEVVIKR